MGNKKTLTFIITISIVLILICCLCCSLFSFSLIGALGQSTNSYKYKYSYGTETSNNKLLAINVAGVINTTDNSSLSILQSNSTAGYSIKDELYRAAKDDSIKGIILVINSPGGTITGANAISDGITYYRTKTHKPVIAYIEGSGESGAYWTAASADYIIADKGSLSGSIGVILGPFQYYDKQTAAGDLMNGVIVTQNGIDTSYITAGKYKDTGSPYRKMTAEETQHWQTEINDEYDLFVNFVSQRRNITSEQIRNQIGALSYGDKEALALKLIDKIGNREDSYAELANRIGIKGDDYMVVTENSSGGILGNILGKSLIKQSQVNCSLCTQPLLLAGNPADY